MTRTKKNIAIKMEKERKAKSKSKKGGRIIRTNEPKRSTAYGDKLKINSQRGGLVMPIMGKQDGNVGYVVLWRLKGTHRLRDSDNGRARYSNLCATMRGTYVTRRGVPGILNNTNTERGRKLAFAQQVEN